MIIFRLLNQKKSFFSFVSTKKVVNLQQINNNYINYDYC